MKAGETVENSDIGVLRTEKILTPGIHPDFLDEIIGAKLEKNAKSGEGVTFSHFMKR